MSTSPHTSIRDVRSLVHPQPRSHKWQNGSVLVIGGSHRYHGAPLLSVMTAARFVDIVHFASPHDHSSLLPNMRKRFFEFIPVFSHELATYVRHVDVVLIGPGLEVNHKNSSLVKKLIRTFPRKRFVLDAGGFRMVPPSLFNTNHLVTPNQKEFADVFHAPRTPASVRAMAKKYNTTILGKGAVTYIADTTSYAENHTGNAGLTKGGTGDILAGLVAALYTKNTNFLAAKAASFLLGETGDALAKKRCFAYTASDVLDELPLIFGKMCKHKPLKAKR